MASKQKTMKNGLTDGDNIKVAVRVRPFNERELHRSAQLIVQMDKTTTALKNPNNPKEQPKFFTFDYSYWSHDGYKTDEDGCLKPKKGSEYISQERIFSDLGISLLDNAWLGYNCSIFAYGQTGSGKSYSITGHGSNAGLVPRTCRELFNQISAKKSSDVAFEVTFSMLEIYNEQVRDLLSKDKSRTNLQVREHPEKGFYVESLKQVAVGTYEDIERSMAAGNKLRTIAATKMNETSSRAHTIVTINFIQNSKKQKTSTHSVINLVDLAGSERQKQAESTGDRFTQAKYINQSLSTLGNVIHALVEVSSKKSGASQIAVMYRNSKLTMLLKNAIGGNSKTIMIAAISPDAENYEQTLSTLTYADRVKQIRTDAKVNKMDTSKLLQGLIAEREVQLKELQKNLANMKYSEDEIQRLREEYETEIKRYQDQMLDIDKEIQRRVEEARREAARKEREEREAEQRLPHLINLNEDPALTGMLMYFCRNSKNLVGNGRDSSPDIQLSGPGIVKEHAVILFNKGEVTLERKLGMVLHNGREMDKPVHLKDGDRIRFGSNNLYIFRLPSSETSTQATGGNSSSNRKSVFNRSYMSYEDAQKEIFKHSGLDCMNDDRLVQEEVMTILPMVQTVNAMAEDMRKPVEFSILLVSPEARGLESGRTEVFIKMVDLESGNEFPWEKNKFIVRYGHMQEMYEVFESTGKSPRLSKEEDPFWEPAELDVIVGVASVPLSFLSFMLEFREEPLSILDYQANHCGYLKVELLPCDSKGNVKDNLCVKDPNDLIEKSVAFKVKVCQATNLPSRFAKTWCRYKFYDNPSYTMTEAKDGQSPKYNHEHLIKIPKVDYKFVQYLEKSLPVEIWGQQKPGSKTGSQVSLPRSRKDDGLQRRIDELEAKNKKLEEKLEAVRKAVEKFPDGSQKKTLQKLLKV